MAEKTYTAEDFIKEYEELCRRTGFQIQVIPVYRPRDDGTFSTILEVKVGKLPA